MNSPGRPPIPDEARRKRQTYVTLTEGEDALLRSCAATLGVDVNTLLRLAVLHLHAQLTAGKPIRFGKPT